MTEFRDRQQALMRALAERVLVLDGATGTMLQQRDLVAQDFGGPALEGCNENLVRTRPDVILDVHRAYLAAGADVIETNSFGSTEIVLAEYGLASLVHELNFQAAQVARQAAAEFSEEGRLRFVAGSMGPTTKAISVTGGISFRDLQRNYYEQAKALVEGGADILLLETCQDTRNLKAGLLAIRSLAHELGLEIPVMASVTVEMNGTMLAGQAVDALWASIAHENLLSVGLNCATGPEFMRDHIRTLHEMVTTRISCHPNAGLPDEEGKYPETPASLAGQLERFVDQGWINLLGGCCGTSPEHIRAIADMVDGKAPRSLKPLARRSLYSGIELVEAEDSNRPLIVGERTNVIGSRLFRNMIAAEEWEEASEIARRQVRNGAHVVDVCLQSSEREEAEDIPPFYDRLIRKIKAPVMIDSTDPKAMELALTYCQGKSILNSINLEEGEKKLEQVCPLAKAYGAALVVGCIDEDEVQAQAFTRERKLAVAQRAHQLLTEKYGIPAEDLIIDCLVFPCATGDENYIGGAVETIEAVRLVKEHLPFVKTTLGVSNVSFGLPAAAREVVNSVFLYHCTKAGLDLAIVNAEKLERFASIPVEERELAEHLLFNTPPTEGDESLRNAPQDWREQSPEQRSAINKFHIGAITDRFREARVKSSREGADIPLDQRLANYIIEGTRDGLVADLDRKLKEGASPIDIVNGPLMAGMSEVGRLFNNNELIVAEVLQSAEAMKAAVSYLEQFMEKSDAAARGKFLLATVKGDVHDIGKNLVEIIFSNNGYEVINLGIKVPPADLIRACRESSPDVIGLSGLLVKSAQQMVVTAADLKQAGIDLPLLVGGAALSDKFTRNKIAPAYGGAACYAKDAMSGLSLLNQIMDPAQRDEVLRSHAHDGEVAEETANLESVPPPSQVRSSKVRPNEPIPKVPYLDRKLRDIPHLTDVWNYINPQMLYGRHLGFKGHFERMLAARDSKALELYQQVEAVKQTAATFMKAKAVWQFFEAERHGNSIRLFAPGEGSPIHEFRFGRQARTDGLCLSDFVLDPRDGVRDHIAVFVVTAGAGIREHAEQAKQRGEYLHVHALQALALETAEGCAEWLHRRIREDWGFPDPASMTMQERFTSKYRGKRYSFGYGACPNLEDQQGIWKLLRPEEIGVALTEGMMMEPEASVSALVFQHPDCTYFTVGE